MSRPTISILQDSICYALRWMLTFPLLACLNPSVFVSLLRKMRESFNLSLFILRMAVLGRALIFQPVLASLPRKKEGEGGGERQREREGGREGGGERKGGVVLGGTPAGESTRGLNIAEIYLNRAQRTEASRSTCSVKAKTAIKYFRLW